MLEFDWDPLPIIMAAEFAALAVGIQSAQEPLQKSVTNVMVPSIRKNFDVGGRPGWAPVAAATAVQKERYGGGGTLVRTGALQSRAGSESIWTIRGEDGYAAIESVPGDVFYGEIHQTGSYKMPARQWAIIQNEDADKIEQVFEDWIDDLIRMI